MNWSERTRALLAEAVDADAEGLKEWHKLPDSRAGLKLDDDLRNDAEKLCVLRDAARKVYWRMYGDPDLSAYDLAALAELDDAIAALDASVAALG